MGILLTTWFPSDNRPSWRFYSISLPWPGQISPFLEGSAWKVVSRAISPKGRLPLPGGVVHEGSHWLVSTVLDHSVSVHCSSSGSVT